MSGQQLIHDAGASTMGTIYQLYVAVEKCFEMVSGQRVLLESYGDVTVSNTSQIEVKHHQDDLTDGHPNLWKTLNNWMQDGFDDTRYAALILRTTQRFGSQAKIARWNEATPEERLTILSQVYQEAERRQARQRGGSPEQDVPKTLLYQRFVLGQARRQKLHRVVEAFVIASCSADASTLYQRITDQYCKPILTGKQHDFLNALLGFVISPGSVTAPTWEITFEQFSQKVQELTPQYCRETRVFPTKHIGGPPPDAPEAAAHSTRLFVRKIRDIEYHEIIVEAIQDYLSASRTILEEFESYRVSQSRSRRYADEVVRVFRAHYRSAARNVVDITRDSQTLYDRVTAERPLDFPGFESTPVAFRNGVLHMHMDSARHDLKWKLG